MTNKSVWAIAVTIIAGLVLCWSTWVSNSTMINRVAIAETRAEVKSEFRNIEKTLDNHYSILKEIRADQKARQ